MDDQERDERIIKTEAHLEALDRLFAALRIDDDKARELALTAIDHRLANLNEYRKREDDRQRDYLPRSEYAVEHKALSDRLAKIEQTQGTISSYRMTLYALLGIVGIILAAVLGHLFAS